PIAAIADAMATPLLRARRRKVLDWVGPHVLRLSAEWQELESRSALGSDDKRALAAFVNPRPISDFARSSGPPGHRAEALAATLLLCGGLDAGEPTSEHPSRATPPHTTTHAAGPMELELELPEQAEPLQLDLDESPTARFEAPPERQEDVIRDFEEITESAVQIRTPMSSAVTRTEPSMTPIATPPPV